MFLFLGGGIQMLYFTKQEMILWGGSVILILGAFLIFGGGYWSLTASLIGVTSLIFAAKGNPLAQVLMIVFSLIYGWISYQYSYYGEMITYLGMTMPMAVISLISWLRHPYKGSHAQVEIHQVSRKELKIIFLATALVTIIFYFILKYLHTANLIFSTVSVLTSFLAVSLTYFRSPYYALAYASNDLILIILWGMACKEDIAYSSVLICFIVFLVNDIYGFLSWKRMEKVQHSA